MTTFEHKGVKIEFNDRAEFVAIINGKLHRTGSLDGMKKKIDQAQASAFKPFKAIDFSLYHREFDVVTVTHMEKQGRTVVFVSEAGRDGQLAIHSPENVAAIKAYLAMKKRRERIANQHEAVEDKAWDKIKFIKAEEYKP